MKGIPKELLKRFEFKQDIKHESSPPKLTKIYYEPVPCEDCKMTVTDRQLSIRLRSDSPGDFYGKFKKHWGIHCKNCDMMQDPLTGEFNIPKKEYSAIMKERHRATVALNKKK